MPYTVTKNPDGDVNLGSLAGEFVTLQPAVADYPPGGYALIGGETANANGTPNLINTDLWRISSSIAMGGQGGLSPIWNPTTQKVQIFGEGPNPGTSLSLGPVSAAKSTAIGVTGTPTSLVTVTIANNLVPGQFVYLSSFTAGGALNGSIVQVVTASATQFTAYAPGAANITAATADVTGTYQLIQAGTGNNLGAGTAATITNSAATSASPSVMTITCANTFVPGQFVVLQGLTTNTALNGVIAQIVSASGTQFTANWYFTGAALTSAADTGTASLLVTSGNAPVVLSQAPLTISNSASTASSAGTAGTVTITAKNSLVAGQIVVAQGMTNLAIQNGGIFVTNAGNLSQTVFVANHLATTVGSAADTTGTVAVLTTGLPTGLSTASGEVQAGTDLSGYAFQLLLLGY
jgi:hypothetical protein